MQARVTVGWRGRAARRLLAENRTDVKLSMIARRFRISRMLRVAAIGSLMLGLANVSTLVDASAADTTIPVVADVARTADVPVFLTGLGSAQPLRSVTVTSRIDGQLTKLDFTDGQDVHAG